MDGRRGRMKACHWRAGIAVLFMLVFREKKRPWSTKGFSEVGENTNVLLCTEEKNKTRPTHTLPFSDRSEEAEQQKVLTKARSKRIETLFCSLSFVAGH